MLWYSRYQPKLRRWLIHVGMPHTPKSWHLQSGPITHLASDLSRACQKLQLYGTFVSGLHQRYAMGVSKLMPESGLSLSWKKSSLWCIVLLIFFWYAAWCIIFAAWFMANNVCHTKSLQETKKAPVCTASTISQNLQDDFVRSLLFLESA